MIFHSCTHCAWTLILFQSLNIFLFASTLVNAKCWTKNKNLQMHLVKWKVSKANGQMCSHNKRCNYTFTVCIATGGKVKCPKCNNNNKLIRELLTKHHMRKHVKHHNSAAWFHFWLTSCNIFWVLSYLCLSKCFAYKVCIYIYICCIHTITVRTYTRSIIMHLFDEKNIYILAHTHTHTVPRKMSQW